MNCKEIERFLVARQKKISIRGAFAGLLYLTIGSLLSGEIARLKRNLAQGAHLVQDTRYKIQETLFNVDFQEYNLITLAMSYFVDKHGMKTVQVYTF